MINGNDVLGRTMKEAVLACFNVISKYLELGLPVGVEGRIKAVRPRNRSKFLAGTLELTLLHFVQTASGPTQLFSQ